MKLIAAAAASIVAVNAEHPCASASGVNAECAAEPCAQAWASNGWSMEQYDECVAGEDEMMGMKYNHIVRMVYSQLTTAHSPKQIFKMLQNYGCHCFPGQSREAGGSGPAVDAQDSLCKSLSRCHKCVSMTYGDVINVNHDKYRWGLKDGEISCDKSDDKHASKKSLCQCDADFAYKLAAIWDDAAYNNFYWLYPKMTKKPDHKQQWATFDIDATCLADSTNSGSADACCGSSFPEMYPYSTSQKSCCHDTTIFNPLLSDCCAGGEIAAPGDC